MFTRNFCTMALTVMAAPLFATEWQTDFEAAKTQAAQEGKALLLDFTGSDWCGCCIQLRKDVLDTPEFGGYAAGKFVCVEVDMPRKKKQPAALAEQNKRICEAYGIRMFPTVLVVSPAGDVLGGFIGTRGSVDRVREPLDLAYANLAKLDAARQVEGSARARGLKEIYCSIPRELIGTAAPYLKEIEDYTPDDVKGEALASRAEFMRALNDAGADYVKALTLIEERLATGSAEEKPELLRFKGMTLLVSAYTEEDLMVAQDCLLEAADLMGGNRGQALRNFVQREFKNPAALLARNEQRRTEEAAATSGMSEAESYIAKLQEKGTDLREALAELEEQLAAAPAGQKAELLRLKGAILLHLAKTDSERAAAKAILDEASALEKE